MNQNIVVLIFTFLTINLFCPEKGLCKNRLFFNLNQDSSNADLETFKQFSKCFFDAIKNNDTVFLKNHIFFPIHSSALGAMIESSSNTKIVNSDFLFKNLHKIFSDDIIYNAEKKGEHQVSTHSDSEIEYLVRFYTSSEDGTEINYSWVFVKKAKSFYFKDFKAEVG